MEKRQEVSGRESGRVPDILSELRREGESPVILVETCVPRGETRDV